MIPDPAQPTPARFSGFRSFVTGAASRLLSWVTGLVGRLASAVLGSARKTGRGVTFSLPTQLGEAAGDKGQRILANLPTDRWTKAQRQTFATDVKASIGGIGRHLGLYFERELALHLAKVYKLKVGMRGSRSTSDALVRLTEQRDDFMQAVMDGFKGDVFSFNKFMAYARENVKTLAAQMIDRTKQLMGCQQVEWMEYTAAAGYFAGTPADITLGCDVGGGEVGEQGWSVKYTSNPSVTVARWKPTQVAQVFGGRGRGDRHYEEIVQSTPDPKKASSVILMDLWTAFAGRRGSVPTQVSVDPNLFTQFVNLFVRGGKGALLAGMNYTTKTSSLGGGAWSEMIAGQFDVGPGGELSPKPGAKVTARLVVGEEDRASAIKLTYQPPGVPWNRATYLEFSINLTNHMGRYVEITMNNLMSQPRR